MTIISNNIKSLRKKYLYTQETFAEAIGVKRSLIGSYEEGRAEPNLETLKKIALILQVTVDQLISQDLSASSQHLPNSGSIDFSGKSLRILTVSVDKEDNEQIVLIPQKASAGYLNGYSDTEYIGQMPHFHLPIFSSGSYRAFEIKGDSMLPMHSGSIIIGQYLEDWNSIRNEKTYVIVTKNEGIVYKRLQNKILLEQSLLFISDNKIYPAYEVDINEIIEIWEAKAFLSTQFPQPEMSMQALSELVNQLQRQIEEIKK